MLQITGKKWRSKKSHFSCCMNLLAYGAPFVPKPNIKRRKPVVLNVYKYTVYLLNMPSYLHIDLTIYIYRGIYNIIRTKFIK